MAAYIASASRNKYGLHIKFRIIVRFMLWFFDLNHRIAGLIFYPYKNLITLNCRKL
jgi:hypothetical protein